MISFAMGGYGIFVWSSYAVMLLIFLINFLLPLKRFRQIKATRSRD